METVADIMTPSVVVVKVTESLYEGHEAMRKHRVRHLPVVDDEGRFVGLLTQRVILREALKIARDRGTSRLAHYEKQIPLTEVTNTEARTVTLETPITEAGRYLLEVKQGGLPVLDQGVVVGILTSADFVKLTLRQLETAAEA